MDTVVRTIGEFRRSLRVMKITGGSFRAEFSKKEAGKLLKTLEAEKVEWWAEGFSPISPRLFLKSLREMPKTCQACGKPWATWFTCVCGTYAWCEDHFDELIFYDHADHDCDYGECCRRGHWALEISTRELEKAIPKAVVTMRGEWRGRVLIFDAAVRIKSKEEIRREMCRIEGEYSVTDWVPELWDSICSDVF